MIAIHIVPPSTKKKEKKSGNICQTVSLLRKSHRFDWRLIEKLSDEFVRKKYFVNTLCYMGCKTFSRAKFLAIWSIGSNVYIFECVCMFVCLCVRTKRCFNAATFYCIKLEAQFVIEINRTVDFIIWYYFPLYPSKEKKEKKTDNKVIL